MTNLEKLEAQEQKERMYIQAKGRCKHCGKPLTLAESQLAHKIRKGYADIYGAKIIHHPLNMDITCAQCNHLSLLSPAANPVQAAELLHRIKDDLRSKKNE